MSQLSFFSAEALPASVDDVEGLLCGPGQAVRLGHEARVSVVVLPDETWRVPVLLDALDPVGLAGETVPAEGDSVAVRTPFTQSLVGLARRWSTAGAKRPPRDLVLDGPRLRWWVMAAGQQDDKGFLLRLSPQDEASWPGVGAALARAGLPATLVGPRADGPGYRITGVRRLARLRELVGTRPDGTPPDAWPTSR